MAKAREDGKFPIPRKGVGLYKTLQPGVWRINTTRILKRDGTDVRDLTRAELEGRSRSRSCSFLPRIPAGFENSTLYDTAATMGVRETRRIVGEYTLTVEDLGAGRQFDDVIALCGYPVDIHSPNSDGGGASGEFPTAMSTRSHRSLVPEKSKACSLPAGRS